MDKLFEKPFSWDNMRHFLNLLPHKAQVRFALFCANQVKHLMKDERSLKALKVVEDFLEGKTTKEECSAAADAALATYTATDAYAATAAAYAAATTAATTAATAAAYAAATAHATADADDINLKQKQMTYLRELITESLSPEDRACWLLVANI